jgi:hypothetical protein
MYLEVSLGNFQDQIVATIGNGLASSILIIETYEGPGVALSREKLWRRNLL